MFQDIPYNFNIDFDSRKIDGGDLILCYTKNQILCSFNKENHVVFPKIKNIDGSIETVFAFGIDRQRYFLSLSDDVLAEGFEYVNLNRLKTSCGINQFAGITGFHYYAFHNENKFCGVCGKKLLHNPVKRCMICESCGNEVFPKISPAVIVGIIDDEKDSIVLTKYAEGDYKKYALVAGFAEMGESAESAARREVMEETGLEITDLRYFKSQPWGFSQNLLIGYFAKVKNSRRIYMDEKELSEARWVKRSDIEAQPDSISLTGEMMWAFKNGDI